MTIRTCLCLEVLREVGRRCSSFLILGILNLVLFREQEPPLGTDKEFVKVLQEASKIRTKVELNQQLATS